MSYILSFALIVAAFGYISAAASERKVKPAIAVPEPSPPRFDPPEEFGMMTRERPADADVQSIADSVKSQLEKKLGPGKVKSNKAITFRRRSVDMALPEGGLTGGINYLIKVEIAPGKYVHENIMLGGGGANLSSVQQNHTLKDELKEFF